MAFFFFSSPNLICLSSLPLWST